MKSTVSILFITIVFLPTSIICMENHPKYAIQSRLTHEHKRLVQSQMYALAVASGADQKAPDKTCSLSLEPIIHAQNQNHPIQNILEDDEVVSFANEIFESKGFKEAYDTFWKNFSYGKIPKMDKADARRCTFYALKYIQEKVESTENASLFEISSNKFKQFYDGLMGITGPAKDKQLRDFVDDNYFEDEALGKSYILGALLAASIASNEVYKASNPYSHMAFNFKYRAWNWWNTPKEKSNNS